MFRKFFGERKFNVDETTTNTCGINTASENRRTYRSFPQTNSWCEPKLNASKDKQDNITIPDGIECTKNRG